jgi:hypothetical protein
MSELSDTQSRIRKGTVMLFTVNQAYEKLPAGTSKDEMLDKSIQISDKLNTLYDQMGDIQLDACYYGFTAVCPGYACPECPIMDKALERPVTQSVEEFDLERIENAREYYRQKKEENAK